MPPALVSGMALKRIHREIADLKREELGGITLAPTDNLFRWKAGIPGPEGSCYEGGVFNADIQLAPDYPFSAPKVVFMTRIYHMNISDKGNVCIDILKHNWSPALSIFKVILSLSSLLTDPNPKDPLVPSIANEYTRNREQHNRTARQWTQMYAHPPTPSPEPIPVVSKPPNATLAHATSAGNSSRVKGKYRAAPSSRAGASAAAAITIDDSDEDVGIMPSEGKRKRKSRTEVHDADALLVSTDEDDDEDEWARRRDNVASKRRKVQASTGGVAAGITSGGGGDVIVIDD